MATLLEHQSRDVDDQAQALTGWTQAYEQLGCGRFRGACWQMVFEQGTLLRESTNRQLRERIVPPRGHVVLALPLAVAPGSMFGGRPLERESLMVFSGEQDYEVMASGELELIGLSVHRDTLAQTLSPEEVVWIEQAVRERNVGLSVDAAAALRQTLLAICGEAERGIDRLAEPGRESAVLSAALAQTVLLASIGDDSLRHSSIPRRADTRARVVQRATEFMRARLNDDLSIPDICAAACASRRSLQYCFEEFLQTTPLAYLRALRLNEARRALKRDPDAPITSVASLYGFSSSSHFTRHYRLMFDELPSETLKLACYGPNLQL